jgi:hypothetical protein
MIDLGAPDQGLAGDTAVMQAVPAEVFLFFDQKSFRPEPGRSGGHGQPCGSAPKNSDIVIVAGHGPSRRPESPPLASGFEKNGGVQPLLIIFSVCSGKRNIIFSLDPVLPALIA